MGKQDSAYQREDNKMGKTVLSVLVGFIIGLILMGTVMYKAAPGLMLTESESMYNFEESVDRFTESVKDKDWKLPKVHDLQKSMANFDKTVGPDAYLVVS